MILKLDRLSRSACSYASRRMPLRRLLLLAAVALAATACGAPGATGKSAAKTVRGDWEFNHDFAGPYADLSAYDTVERIGCTSAPDARTGDIHCRLLVAAPDGRRRRVGVVVHYDEHGILEGWDLERAPARGAPA
jgi:hypothetical protein